MGQPARPRGPEDGPPRRPVQPRATADGLLYELPIRLSGETGTLVIRIVPDRDDPRVSITRRKS